MWFTVGSADNHIVSTDRHWRRSRPLSDRERAACEEVYALRAAMDLSQRQFARLVGAVPETVGRWERAWFVPSYPKLFRLRQLADMMNVLGADGYQQLQRLANAEPGRFGQHGPRV